MYVTPKDAIKMMQGNMSNNELSRRMGKSREYVHTSISRKIGAQVMIDILDALNCDTIARNRSTGEEITISPSNAEMIVPHSITITIADDKLHERIEQLMSDGKLETELYKLLT